MTPDQAREAERKAIAAAMMAWARSKTGLAALVARHWAGIIERGEATMPIEAPGCGEHLKGKE